MSGTMQVLVIMTFIIVALVGIGVYMGLMDLNELLVGENYVRLANLGEIEGFHVGRVGVIIEGNKCQVLLKGKWIDAKSEICGQLEIGRCLYYAQGQGFFGKIFRHEVDICPVGE